MFSAGARQVTVATNSPSASVSVNGGAWPPTPSDAVAAGAVVPAVARGREELGAAVDEGLIEVLDGAGLPPGLVEPVEREADRRDRHQDEPGAEGTGEPRALERLVVVVGLAVGRQLDLGGDLGSTGADVDDDVGDEADPGDHRDHHADCLHRAGRQHGRGASSSRRPPRGQRSRSRAGSPVGGGTCGDRSEATLGASDNSVLPAADAVGAFGLLAGGVGADGRAGDDLAGRCRRSRCRSSTTSGKRSRPRGAGPPFFSPLRLYCEPWHWHSNHCDVLHSGTRQPRWTHFW